MRRLVPASASKLAGSHCYTSTLTRLYQEIQDLHPELTLAQAAASLQAAMQLYLLGPQYSHVAAAKLDNLGPAQLAVLPPRVAVMPAEQYIRMLSADQRLLLFQFLVQRESWQARRLLFAAAVHG